MKINVEFKWFHGHQGKQLKAYVVHKRSLPQGEKKKLQDNTKYIIEEKNQRIWQENLFAAFKLQMIHYEYKFAVKIHFSNP